MTTLALALQSRGREVVFMAIPDAEPMIRACGLAFVPVGAHSFPAGELGRRLEQLSRLSGQEGFAFTVQTFADEARAVLEDGSRALAEARADALVLDATQLGLNLVAIKQGLPFVQVSNALHFDLSGRAPLCVYPWSYEDTPEAIARNIQGLIAFGNAIGPIRRVAAEYIERNGLDLSPEDIEARSSRLARITQCPRAFDFPGDHHVACFHYAGPFHAKSLRPGAPFPWEQLTGEPLIYASMGTLQNGSESIFRAIVQAAEAPGRQLVLSIGRNLDPASIGPVAGNTIVVAHAPQLSLLEGASLCITHAGLNTTLEALSAGVPMVAIPITNDQPGVGARIAFTGTGEVIPLQELTVDRLRQAVDAVLSGDSYRQAAQIMRTAIQQTDGLNQAVAIIDRVLCPTAPA
jgi:MGT family glycosyltransferase